MISDAAAEFGKDRITVAVDARRNKAMPSGFELVVSGGTLPVEKDCDRMGKEMSGIGCGSDPPYQHGR